MVAGLFWPVLRGLPLRADGEAEGRPARSKFDVGN